MQSSARNAHTQSKQLHALRWWAEPVAGRDGVKVTPVVTSGPGLTVGGEVFSSPKWKGTLTLLGRS